MQKREGQGLEALSRKANEALQALRLDEALEAYLRVLEASPDAYDAHVGLSRVYTRMRRQDDAVASAERAVEIDPDRHEAYAMLGALRFLVDENEEAASALERAIELAPDEPEPHLTLAQVLADRKESEEAEAQLTRARELIEALPEEAERLAWRAMAHHVETYLHLADGQDGAAMEAAQEAIALEEANPYAACLAYSNLGIIHARQRKYDLGIEYLEKALALNPYFFRAGNALGRLLLVRNRAQEAVEVLEKALEQAPDENPSTRYAYATALAKSGRRAEALAQFRQALQQGLTGADALMARVQTVWLSQVGRYAVIGAVAVAAIVWFVVAKPSSSALTLVAVLVVLIVLQQTLGRRRR